MIYEGEAHTGPGKPDYAGLVAAALATWRRKHPTGTVSEILLPAAAPPLAACPPGIAVLHSARVDAGTVQVGGRL